MQSPLLCHITRHFPTLRFSATKPLRLDDIGWSYTTIYMIYSGLLIGPMFSVIHSSSGTPIIEAIVNPD